MGASFLGLDVGTSGCRGVAIDVQGEVLAVADAALPAPLRGADGSSRQDPAIWWSTLVAVLGELAEALAVHPPQALALDATATTLLLASEQGEPLGPALMYDDRSAVEQARRILATLPPESPVHGATSSLSKLLFLLDRYRPASRVLVLHQADWLTGRLCGRFGSSDWNNCLRLGYDPQREEWAEWLQTLDLERVVFPRVLPPGTPIAHLTADLARRTGLPRDLMICAGTTDSTAAVAAAGIERPGDGVTVLGSTLVVKIATPLPLTDSAHGVYSHRFGDLWLAGGASNSGGAVLRRFFSDAHIAELAERLRPDAPTGLDYYPLLRPGERFPVNDPDLPPRLQPRPSSDTAFLQGLLEGIADIEARGYALLESLGAARLRRVLSIGGGARNTAWERIRALRLGVPVSAAPQQQAAYGAALLARSGIRHGPLEAV
jgi:sugar (pentulose or hexulose) kinase